MSDTYFVVINNHFVNSKIITIIIDNLCIALFSGVHKLTALYNILQKYMCHMRSSNIYI